MFPQVLSTSDGRSEGTYGRSKPRATTRFSTGEFSDNWSMFVEQRQDSSVINN